MKITKSVKIGPNPTVGDLRKLIEEIGTSSQYDSSRVKATVSQGDPPYYGASQTYIYVDLELEK